MSHPSTQEIRSSKSSLATEQVQDQSRLHEIMSQMMMLVMIIVFTTLVKNTKQKHPRNCDTKAELPGASH